MGEKIPLSSATALGTNSPPDENFRRAQVTHASGGAYLNFPGFLEEGQSLVRASMGGNYTRLAQLKQRLDPENLFRRNANIEPEA